MTRPTKSLKPKWWLTLSLVRKKRILMRVIHTTTLERDRLGNELREWERELAEVDAAIDAAKDDGVDLLAEWRRDVLDDPEPHDSEGAT